MKTNAARSTCSISYALDFLGDKWTLLILRDMMLDGKSAYVDFLSSDEKIASNILSDRLKMLVAGGFLRKRVSPDNKSKFLYSLTDKAIDLFPLLMEYQAWGAKYNQHDIPKDITTDWNADRNTVLRTHQDRLRRERRAVEQ